MDTMVLDPESFNAKQELAKIGENIAKGEAVLKELQDTSEAYTLEREEKVKARIAEVLKESYESLQQISANRDALQHYATDLDMFAIALSDLLSEYRKLRTTQKEKAEEDGRSIKAAWDEIAKVRNDLQVMRGNIDADALANERDREWIADEKRKIIDERGTLERAFSRLKK